jgi:arabinogalactan oligomer / maltooligosaccharide transport system permease protein
MSLYEQPVAQAAAQAAPVAATKRPAKKSRFGENWWRHLIAILAVAVAIFPVIYIVSAAFNQNAALNASDVNPWPTHWTLGNFGTVLHGSKAASEQTFASIHYVRWFINSVIVALCTALMTVLLGALAAYSFSRFRFRGRRMGMLFLLLIQMFPQPLAIAAIYLIVLRAGDVVHQIGLNTLLGLMLVYLGGALGVNTWLLKGFFDTIPSELDESARVDGATAGQIFWGVVLPLAAPVLTVVGLFSFISTINEFLIASVLLQTKDNWTLPLGLRGFIDQQYGQHWGPFAAGVLLAAIPAIILWQFLQRYVVAGLTQGSVKG